MPDTRGEIELRERSFVAGDLAINYAQGPPNGPAVVLVHGGSARWQHWLPLATDLASTTQVFAPDLRGHGRSSWTPHQYRLVDFAADLEAFLAGVVRSRSVLVGHSLGGEVTLIVAADRPDLVRGVIDEDGPISAEVARRSVVPSRPRLRAMRALAGSSLPEEELLARVAELPLSDDPRTPGRLGDVVGRDRVALAMWADTFRRHDPTMLDAVIQFEDMHAGFTGERVLPQIQCPVLILQADPLVGAALEDADVAWAKRLLKDGRSLKLAGRGHAMHYQDPGAVGAAVSRWVASLDS